jgi:ubiquinone/menaquinone biosynthesis C-methylase UbiE
MAKRPVQAQFGASAEAYAISEIHAKGSSLTRLIELVEPQPFWIVLDVATAAGHTAHAFAPYVKRVVASDITSEMLQVAARLGRAKNMDNEDLTAADAEKLPLAGQKFDLVTCRLAAHHFPNIGRFMEEAWRVLREGGTFAVVDNVVPGSLRGGKVGRLQEEAGRYVNAFDKLRDPSHERSLSMEQWKRTFYESGFRLIHQEEARKSLGFEAWAERMRVSAKNVVHLRAMLQQAPQPVIDFMNPRVNANDLAFDLTEAIFVAKKDLLLKLDRLGSDG